MTDQLTPDDGLDQAIRAAVRDLVVTAPPAPPYTQIADGTRSTPATWPDRRRWWGASAAAVVAALGLGALAYGLGSRSDDTPAATTPTLPAPAPTGAPAPTTQTTPSPTPALTTPQRTAPDSAPPSTQPATPSQNSLFPEPTDPALTTQTAIAPSGSIDAAPGDMVTIGVDGDVWLHRGAFDPTQYGRPAEAPVRLVDGEDVRAVEGEIAPNTPQWVGGFVNGALIYGDCCEPAAGNVLAVSEPEGPSAELGFGWSAAADSTGRRWATVNDYGLQLLDFTGGRGVTRGLNLGDGEYLNTHEVFWSPDDTELWVLGWTTLDGSMLVRFSADSSLTELGRIVLAVSDGEFPSARFEFAGRLADGTAVLTQHAQEGSTEITGMRLLDAAAGEIVTESPWTLPEGARQARVSPDGTTLAVVTADSIAYLVRAGQEPVEWGTDVSAVGFVTTPAMPIGTADCPTPDPDRATWSFADLDGDGLSERIPHASDGVLPSARVTTCGTPLGIDTHLPYAAEVRVQPVDVEGDGRSELWVVADTWGAVGQCAVLHRLDPVGTLVADGQIHCIGSGEGGEGMACVAVDGVTQPVYYHDVFERNILLPDSDPSEVVARLDDGTEIGRRSYDYVTEADDLDVLYDLAC